LLIGHPSLGQSRRAVAPPQVTALHHHAIQSVHQTREPRAALLHHRDQLHAHGLQPLLVLTETAAALAGGVTKPLELLPGAGLAGADAALDLALGRGAAVGLDARGHPLQSEVPLDLSHDGFLPLVVLAIADDLAAVGDSVGQDVDVLVVGVGVPGDDELVVSKPHTTQITLRDLPPLLVGQVLAGGRG